MNQCKPEPNWTIVYPKRKMKLAKLLFDILVYIPDKVSFSPECFEGIDEIINTGHIDILHGKPCPPIKKLPTHYE